MENNRLCAHCGIKLIQNENESSGVFERRLYCNNSCKQKRYHVERFGYKEKAPSKKITMICPVCGTSFKTYKYLIDKGSKYCSGECKHKGISKHEIKEFNGKRYYLRSKGYFCSDDNHRLNRDVWEFYNGPIPEGYIVHHIDEDKANNDISNLELVEWGEHTKKHHAYEPFMTTVYCKHCGKPIERRTKDVIKSAMLGRDSFCSQRCINKHRPTTQKSKKVANE